MKNIENSSSTSVDFSTSMDNVNYAKSSSEESEHWIAGLILGEIDPPNEEHSIADLLRNNLDLVNDIEQARKLLNKKIVFKVGISFPHQSITIKTPSDSDTKQKYTEEIHLNICKFDGNNESEISFEKSGKQALSACRDKLKADLLDTPNQVGCYQINEQLSKLLKTHNVSSLPKTKDCPDVICGYGKQIRVGMGDVEILDLRKNDFPLALITLGVGPCLALAAYTESQEGGKHEFPKNAGVTQIALAHLTPGQQLDTRSMIQNLMEGDPDGKHHLYSVGGYSKLANDVYVEIQNAIRDNPGKLELKFIDANLDEARTDNVLIAANGQLYYACNEDFDDPDSKLDVLDPGSSGSDSEYSESDSEYSESSSESSRTDS